MAGLGKSEKRVATIAAGVTVGSAADLALRHLAVDVVFGTLRVQWVLRVIEHHEQLGLVGVQPLQQTVKGGETGAPLKEAAEWLSLRQVSCPLSPRAGFTRILTAIDNWVGKVTHHDIERAKWRLWHGRWEGCLMKLVGVCRWTEAKRIRDTEGVRALRHHLHDLIAYVEENRAALVHYGARHRRGEPISTAFVESAINEIVARRMIKKQPMRWNRWAVQLFLDVRVAVLDEPWRTRSASSIPTSGSRMTPPPSQPLRELPTLLHALP